MDKGASADADRACALRAEPAAQSQAESLVPSAEEVLAHARLVAPEIEMPASAAITGELRVCLAHDYGDVAWMGRLTAVFDRHILKMPYRVDFLRARTEAVAGSTRRLLLEYRFRPTDRVIR